MLLLSAAIVGSTPLDDRPLRLWSSHVLDARPFAADADDPSTVNGLTVTSYAASIFGGTLGAAALGAGGAFLSCEIGSRTGYGMGPLGCLGAALTGLAIGVPLGAWLGTWVVAAGYGLPGSFGLTGLGALLGSGLGVVIAVLVPGGFVLGVLMPALGAAVAFDLSIEPPTPRRTVGESRAPALTCRF